MEAETILRSAEQPPRAEPTEQPAVPAHLPRGRPFVNGQSGNPAGRPSRARVAAIVAEGMIGRKTVPLTQKVIDQALAGDRAALRLCLERIAPRRREQPIALNLPPMEKRADIFVAMTAVADAAASGAITSEQAAKLVRMLMTVYCVA